MSGSLHAAFPSGPLIDTATGEILPVWRAYFTQLYVRTGGAQGASTPVVAVGLVAESTARTTADTSLSGAIATERTDRETADTAEAAARLAGDAARLLLAGGTMTGPLVGPTAVFTTYFSGTAAGPSWTSGTAAPAATAPVGSLYSRVGGAVGATLYVSRGAGVWNAVAGV